MKTLVGLAMSLMLFSTVQAQTDFWEPAGIHSVTWHATGFPSGVHFYRLRSGLSVETRKLSLTR